MTLSFSVNWGSPTARRDSLLGPAPFATDADAKAARDATAKALRARGVKVHKWQLKRQRRDYWGWQQPCTLPPCTIYYIDTEKA